MHHEVDKKSRLENLMNYASVYFDVAYYKKNVNEYLSQFWVLWVHMALYKNFVSKTNKNNRLSR